MSHAVDRRTVLKGALGASALTAAGFVASSPAAASSRPKDAAASRQKDVARLVVLGTTDLHGNVFNWDYFKNAEYDDAAHNDIGLAKVSTLISAARGHYGVRNTLTLDAGDTIQGTPLAYYYAKIKPIGGKTIHPMAAAMNHIGYDAAALGNHEFNYGIPLLRTFEDQLDFPLLGANALNWKQGTPAFYPWVMKTVRLDGAAPVKVGILGLVTPGIAIWDKANVEGKMRFGGIVEQAKVWVPKMKAAGAEVVVVSCHSGPNPSSSYGDALPFPENASTQLAQQVPGIDAILVGHAHLEVPQRFVPNEQTGQQVLLSEPLKWGMRVTVMDLELHREHGRWTVAASSSQVLNANTVKEDPAVVKLINADHQTVVKYVNSKVGTSTTELSAATAPWRDVPALDFVNYVQSDIVSKGIAGTAAASLPLVSIAAPFNREASIPAGDVSVRDVAGLYIYDNTLLAIQLSGAQIKDYLEYSAAYFQQQSSTGPVSSDAVTNAKTSLAPDGTPDYNYDVMAGYAKRLTYDVELSVPAGSNRIRNLAYDGKAVDPAQQFVVAINNYRQSGGGGFPHVTTAPVVYNPLSEIRQGIIDWVTAHQTIDPAMFASVDWKITYQGQPITVTPA